MKRAVTQDDWKRSQVRMPQEQYDRIMNYAEKNNISLNTAMLTLIDKSLALEEKETPIEVSNLNAQLSLKGIQELINSLITPQHRELLDKIEQIRKQLP